jgi:HemY protein
MVRLIVFLLLAIGASLLAAWFANNPGLVEITWLGQQLQTSVGVLVLAVVLAAVLATVLYEIYRVVRRAPRQLRERRRRNRRERGYAALADGLVAAAAGDTAAAKASTRRAEKLLEHAPQTLLLSAQTAQLDGDEGNARAKFQAMLAHPQTEFLGLRGLLAQAIKDGDREAALALAGKAYQRRPATPWVLTTLFELQTQEGRWQDALGTVADMARYKVVPGPQATRYRAILLHLQARDKRAENRPYEAFDLALKAHKLVHGLAPLAIQASELAAQLDKHRQARKIIETAWKAQPHPDLAQTLAALTRDPSPAARVRMLERLQQLHPDSLEGELALAEQAMAATQWPAARDALKRALKLGPTASVFRLLAELERATDGDPEQVRLYLAKAVEAPPDPAWLCRATGEAVAEWAPFGPDGKFDSLRWGAPPKIVPLLREHAPAELILPNSARAPFSRSADEFAIAPVRPDGGAPAATAASPPAAAVAAEDPAPPTPPGPARPPGAKTVDAA